MIHKRGKARHMKEKKRMGERGKYMNASLPVKVGDTIADGVGRDTEVTIIIKKYYYNSCV